MVIVPVQTYPPFPKNTPINEKVETQAADKAVVVLKQNGKFILIPYLIITEITTTQHPLDNINKYLKCLI